MEAQERLITSEYPAHGRLLSVLSVFLQGDSNSTARYVIDHLPPYGLYLLLVMMALDPCGNYDKAIIITGKEQLESIWCVSLTAI